VTDRKSIIRVRDLKVGYGEHIILDQISLDVYEGEVFVILGGSGCGKSTLLKSIIGLITPFAGRVMIDGERVLDDEAQLKQVFRKIGVLYQGAALFGSMTIAENVSLPIKAYTALPESFVNIIVKMKLGLVNLDGYENLLPSELSGGMKKRAGLARAMALNPKILFFDEPSAGLDPVTSAELDHLILQLNKNLGTTMVIVTHELQSIFAVAQRVVMLDKRSKGIIAEGDPKYLRDHSQNESVRRFFNRQAEEGSGL
jgi:phospholipid/cholesterol/gamma-HCH transport system ATP-binding protein